MTRLLSRLAFLALIIFAAPAIADTIIPPPPAPLAGFRNKLYNPTGAVDQRAVSGTVTLAAGAYGHDGVKAGSGGAVYTFAASGLDTTFTITSGTLVLPIEAANIEGGTYTFAQDGTAQARVYQGAPSGSFAAASRTSPLTVTGLAAATGTFVEISTGTLVRPQFEAGPAATTFERRPPGFEFSLCQRYYQILDQHVIGQASTASAVFFIGQFMVPMRAPPTSALLVTSLSAASFEMLIGATWVSASSMALSAPSTTANSYAATVTGFSGLTAGQLATGNNTRGFFSFSAEL